MLVRKIFWPVFPENLTSNILFLEFSHEWEKSPEKMSTLITMLEVTQNASNYRESKPINQMQFIGRTVENIKEHMSTEHIAFKTHPPLYLTYIFKIYSVLSKLFLLLANPVHITIIFYASPLRGIHIRKIRISPRIPDFLFQVYPGQQGDLMIPENQTL